MSTSLRAVQLLLIALRVSTRRHAINLHHAVETIANYAKGLTRSPPDGRRAKVANSVCQQSGCDRIVLVSFHELPVECELNSIRRKL